MKKKHYSAKIFKENFADLGVKFDLLFISNSSHFCIFAGITGHVRIDDNGDRDADYSLLDLDPITGRFAVVAHYYGVNRSYTPVKGQDIILFY